MQTHLGASALLGPSDIHTERIAASAYVYVEGYLWSSPTAMQAAETAIHQAESAGVRVALSLSDPSMVKHFRDTFRAVAAASADVVFCNEREAMLYAGLNEESGSPEQRKRALRALAEDAPLVFMTLGVRRFAHLGRRGPHPCAGPPRAGRRHNGRRRHLRSGGPLRPNERAIGARGRHARLLRLRHHRHADGPRACANRSPASRRRSSLGRGPSPIVNPAFAGICT